jgi:endonuclease G
MLTGASVLASVTRVDNFREDAEVPAAVRATLADYSGSGYDRGHLAPNASVDFSVAAMDESFLLSNIAPQNSTLNQNAWAELEGYVRACAVTKGELVVTTGPFFNSTNPARIGTGVAVPDGFFTAMLHPRESGQAMGFMVPNQGITPSMLPSYVTSVDAIEAKTGLNLFPALKDNLESTVEAQTMPICPLPWSATGSTGTGSTGGTTGTGATGGSSGPTYGACGTKNYCSQMTSCAEARYFLNTCGVRTMDGDGDGTPCETICR